MDREQRRNWILMGGVVLMLLALFSYVATLDDSDAGALPDSAVEIEQGGE